MKLYIERRDGMIRVQMKHTSQPLVKRETYRTVKEVEDTPENFADIERWADTVGHTLEEKPPRREL